MIIKEYICDLCGVRSEGTFDWRSAKISGIEGRPAPIVMEKSAPQEKDVIHICPLCYDKIRQTKLVADD